MRIQHNILAMNSYRNYSNNTTALGKNLEKLSSGYKINRAGDDAAGLAISEKMRAQIQGLTAAQKNVKDGISLVKTAEGAMQEIQDMLSRMKYLATQSANGTYDSAVDRTNLQMEVDELLEEIDRIADNANFNDIYLLDGTYDDGSVKLGASASGDELVANFDDEENLADMGLGDISFEGLSSDITDVKIVIATDASNGKAKAEASFSEGVLTIKLTTGTSTTFADQVTSTTALADIINKALKKAAAKSSEVRGVTVSGSLDASAVDGADNGDNATAKVGAPALSTFTENSQGTKLAAFGLQSIDLSGLEVNGTTDVEMWYEGSTTKTLHVYIGDKEYIASFAVAASASASITLVNVDDSTDTISAVGATTPILGSAGQGEIDFGVVGTLSPKEGSPSGGGGGLQLQIGDHGNETLNVAIGDMHHKAMGLKNLSIKTAGDANAAMDKIKTAINYVSQVRGKLGATQNRLEHTQNNLSVMTENIQDAESTIRDTDVADEMMGYVKNNILVQSAQAMLAQANQVPQGVLQLLG